MIDYIHMEENILTKIKHYYLEVICGIFFSLALGYFFVSLYGNRKNEEFLHHARSKLLLMEARSRKQTEQRLNEQEEKSCRDCFESSLTNAGFKNITIERKMNYLCAHVNNDVCAREKLSQTLESTNFIEMVISWKYVGFSTARHRKL